jgi:hypothetical protein
MVAVAVMAVAVAAQVVAFTDVARGSSSALDEPRTVVVRTADEWRTLWTSHTTAPLPRVDFSRLMVVGVFLGIRPTAGFSVRIQAVRRTSDGAVVEYAEQTPDPDAMTAQVLTAPFHMITIPRDIQTVEFKKITGDVRGMTAAP